MWIDQIGNVLSRLGLQSAARLSLVQSALLADAHVPPFAPDAPALLLGFERAEAAQVQQLLLSVYPPDFGLRLLLESGEVQEFSLAGLAGRCGSALLVPALGPNASFEAFQEIIAHLRAPEDGCPWDKEQTHLTLRKHLLEESYETLAALDEADVHKMREEFGDLLLQVVLHAQIASEAGEFTMAQVLQGIHDKIVRRHPHVFGELQVDGVEAVLSNWEAIKAGERKTQGEQHKGALDGLPAALPAMIQAQEIQARVARVGFDWPELGGVLDKVQEEIEEVRAAANPAELNDELGDLFFTLVNLARWKKLDAEAALREASLKFKRRFQYVEQRAREQQRPLQEMSLSELDTLWNEAKQQA